METHLVTWNRGALPPCSMALDMRRWLARASLVVGVFLPACISAPAKQANTGYLEEIEVSQADHYMPLENGAVYAYDTRFGQGETGMMTIQIRHTADEAADLQIGGRHERVKIDRTGIRFLDGGYLLKPPLDGTTTWEGKAGIVRVTGVAQKVDVPAGHFQGCIRTEERDSGLHGERRTVSVYCPHVGLVSFDSVGPRGVRETAVLRRYGPRMDPLIDGVAVASDL